MKTRMLIFCAFPLFVTGCLPPAVEYTPVNAPPRDLSPRDPSMVEVFIGQAPSRPHTDVGMIQGWRLLSARVTAAVLANMRAEAAQIGCDGLVVLGSDEKGLFGACIVYEDGPPVPAPPPPVAQ